MKFIADFHIHSHFSLATSGQLTPEHLDRWGRIKGVKVVGTGDFTHPGWLAELRDKLEPAEPGLFRLRRAAASPEWSVPESAENAVRFLLTAEISCIYKKDGRVRKIHNVIFAPDFAAADRIQRKLKSLDFNITSDGRPILGMDSRDLLELALDASPDVFFVPAHIWTPWFSALGEKSGFDRIDECYADLSGHIHAVESGLSSDPAMNDLCSALDGYALISNSDAHSPDRLGREANRFDTELSYPAITSALKNPDSAAFQGTLEFFPQEGKYHLDGHRKCGVSWEPEETQRRNGMCPACGRRVTIGVLHRVRQLSDRRSPDEKKNRRPFHSMIPLIEIMAEIRGMGRSSKAVVRDYAALVQRLDSEISILLDRPIGEIQRAGGELAAEAVRRMREGEVLIEAGYDGEYGVIKVFRKGEIRKKSHTGLFAGVPQGGAATVSAQTDAIPRMGEGGRGRARGEMSAPPAGGTDNLPPGTRMAAGPATLYQTGAASASHVRSGEADNAMEMNPAQKAAAEHAEGPAMVLAGPGTGKTAVLTRRVAVLIRRGVEADRILVITFTNKAAGEIQNRVSAMPGSGIEGSGTSRSNGAAGGQVHARFSAVLEGEGFRLGKKPAVMTFHSFGNSLLRSHAAVFGRGEGFTIFDEDEKIELLKTVIPKGMNVRQAAERIRRIKQYFSKAETSPSPEFIPVADRYEDLLRSENGFDFDDLIGKPLRLLNGDPEILSDLRARFDHILLDEFQDIDAAQYELMRLLAGSGPAAGLWAVGDPDQSIYGFRGASPDFISRFQVDYPGTVLYALVQSYRCTDIILRASEQVIRGSGLVTPDSGPEIRCSPKDGIQNSSITIRKSGMNAFNSKPEIRNPKLHGTGEGVKIQIVEHPTDASEAEAIARTIESMTGGLRFFSMDSGVTTGYDDPALALSDFAVLCRIGRQMDAFEKAFHDHGIPYQKSDSEPFYRREPVRSVVAVLKKAVRDSGLGIRGSGFGELDGSAGLKISDSALHGGHLPFPREWIGTETVPDLIEKTLATVPEASAPAHRHEMEELLELAEPYGCDADGFIRLLSLGTGQDLFKPGLQSVALMSLHASKGLEFACVFLPGLEDGLLPYRLVERLEADPEEERRLLYVGMTRAKRTLFLSHCRKRVLSGRKLTLPRSPFLDAIEAGLLERGAPSFRKRRGGHRGPQMEIF